MGESKDPNAKTRQLCKNNPQQAILRRQKTITVAVVSDFKLETIPSRDILKPGWSEQFLKGGGGGRLRIIN